MPSSILDTYRLGFVVLILLGKSSSKLACSQPWDDGPKVYIWLSDSFCGAHVQFSHSKILTELIHYIIDSTFQFPMTNKSGLSHSIPINSYIPVVGVHTTLWAFTALYLPRTTLIDTEWDSSQQLSSRDRPQHPFLVALTQNPTWTLACICVGAGFVQSWWAGQVRRWWLDLSIQHTEGEKRMPRGVHKGQPVVVRINVPELS